MNTVLITGAAGYVGSTLCDTLLRAGFKVRALDNFYRGSCDSLIPFITDPNFEFFNADVTDPNLKGHIFEGVNYVIHLAALVGFPKCAANTSLAILTNEEGTRNIATHAKRVGAKMILASTGSVYGKVDGICTEESPLNAVSLYGMTKINAEKLMFATLPCQSIAYRFATGFGVGRTTRVNLLVNTLTYEAIINRTITVFEADARRTFIHNRDMASSFLHGILNFDDLQPGLVYNVGDNSMNATKRELVTMIANKTGCHTHFAEVGVDLDQRDYAVSFDKFHNTGWNASITIEQGINELVKVTPLLHIHSNYE